VKRTVKAWAIRLHYYKDQLQRLYKTRVEAQRAEWSSRMRGEGGGVIERATIKLDDGRKSPPRKRRGGGK